MAPLRTVPIPDISGNAVGHISVPNAVARNQVRIFHRDETHGTWKIVHEHDTFDAGQLKSGLSLGIDARDIRRPDGWDGRALVRFTVQSGDSTSADEVMLRVAPVLTHSNLQTVEQVMTIEKNCSLRGLRKPSSTHSFRR